MTVIARELHVKTIYKNASNVEAFLLCALIGLISSDIYCSVLKPLETHLE